MGDLTHERLCSLLKYDPLTGEWEWRKTRRGILAGPAGCKNSNGYLVIRVDGVLHYGHRLAWFYMTSEWPLFEVDHENTTPGDDRWENLRPATHAQNQKNQKRRRDNTSGRKGVSLTHYGRWRASIRAEGKQFHLGVFDTVEQAAAAYAAAAREKHGSFGRAS
jgi:hypothetical protein